MFMLRSSLKITIELNRLGERHLTRKTKDPKQQKT